MSAFLRLLIALLAVAAASLGTTWFVLQRTVERAARIEHEAYRDRITLRIAESLASEPDLVAPVTRWADRVETLLAGAAADPAPDLVEAAARAEHLDGWLLIRPGNRARLSGGTAAPRELPAGGIGDADTWWARHGDRLVRCAAGVRGLAEGAPGRGLALIGCRALDAGALADQVRRRAGTGLTSVEILPAAPGRPAPRADEGTVLVPIRGRRGVLAWVRARPAGNAGGVGLAARVRAGLAGGLAAGSAVAGLLAAVLAAGQVAPLRRLARAVDGITAGGLDPEPMPRSPGETGRLARAIDRMLAGLREEQLGRIDAERRAAFRDVARRLAHEVRNPLTPIRLAVDNLRRAARSGPEAVAACVEEETAVIAAEVDRLERLVREFAEFARLPAPSLRPVDPGPLVRDAVAGQIAGHPGIDLSMDVPDGLPRIDADPDLLGAAIANIARNAVEALGTRGGRISLEVEGGPDRVVIRLADDGPGIPTDLAAEIFEPHVSGRASSGLGLAITRRIVEQHAGSVRASSGPERGAVFTIELPVTAGAGRAKKR